MLILTTFHIDRFCSSYFNGTFNFLDKISPYLNTRLESDPALDKMFNLKM